MNGGRLDKDDYFLQMAALVARRGTCLRRAVGCVLVNELGHVIATGYNGVARGMPHCNDRVRHYDERDEVSGAWVWKTPHACPAAHAASGTQLEGCEAIHAEQNALLQCGDVGKIRTCYVTTAPCVTCTKLLLNTGCRRIIFSEDYPQAQAARDLWQRDPELGRVWTRLQFSSLDRPSPERPGPG